MDDSFDDDSFDGTDDSFDDDETKENDSDDEQHGLKILQCYCKAKKMLQNIEKIKNKKASFCIIKKYA